MNSVDLMAQQVADVGEIAALRKEIAELTANLTKVTDEVSKAQQYIHNLDDQLWRKEELGPPTYHDIVIHLNGESRRLFDLPYDTLLQCTRTGGWSLWKTSNRGDEQIGGGEEDDLRVSVRGQTLFHHRPRYIGKSKLEGDTNGPS